MKPTLKPALFYIISAEFLFATSSLLVKMLWVDFHISAFEAAFARFVIGLLTIGIYMIVKKVRLRPKNLKALTKRGVLNALALFFYYYALRNSTVTKANILNMTYPLFIAVLAPFLLNERSTPRTILLVLLAFIGVYLVVDPHFSTVTTGDWFALLSGLTAALAIISLREARKTDSTFTVIVFLMVIGTIGNLLFIPTFTMPHGIAWFYLVVCGVFGFIGQILLTYGYKDIAAVEGSLASTSRIIFATILGLIFFQEHLTALMILGTSLIIYATVAMQKN